jgi:valine--pyruvate aminotransferase
VSDFKGSVFGRRLSQGSGINELMEDLGHALDGSSEMIMMGGGAPALIPGMESVWRRHMEGMLRDGRRFEDTVGLYDTPRGRPRFLETFAAFLNRVYGWNLTPENVTISLGSQSAFFMLFHLFAGPDDDGRVQKVLFPMVPEYIGYADQAMVPDMFVGRRPIIEHTAPHRFKYRIDFQHLNIADDIGAICVSRPTNPTANVLTDEELRRLADLALERDVYLLVDNAYGAPFPNILFQPTQPVWNERTVHAFSLSKLGLPATRTGIVTGPREVIERLGAMNAVLALASTSVGQALTEPLFANDDVLRLSREVIQPHYARCRNHALDCLHHSLPDELDYHVHEPEGAFFLWLWLRDLPIHVRELYERLKRRNVLVVPGHYFYPGYDTPWKHKQECIRISYVQNPADVRRGIGILGEEVVKAYGG